MPMIAFIGVRISWLMDARNVVLVRLALSARSRATASSFMTRWRCVMSIQPPTTPTTAPPALRNGSIQCCTSISRPLTHTVRSLLSGIPVASTCR
ncbi:hypothetical protein D3C71_1776490 [compost metagenome]